MCAGATASCRCLVREVLSPKRRDGATTQTRPQPGYCTRVEAERSTASTKVKPTTVPCCCARGLTSESCLVNGVLSAGLALATLRTPHLSPDSVCLSLLRPRPTRRLMFVQL
jgi:hypothetical protein